jgi:hypothetical protein
MPTWMIALLVAPCIAAERGASGPWTPRTLERYARARNGLWRGRGHLINTLTGARIAEVDYLEDVLPGSGTKSDAKFGSRRVLVYKAADGTRLGEAVRYDHNVSVELSDGNLMMRAAGPSGDVVASGWGVGRGPLRTGLRRTYEVSVRPIAKNAAADAPVPTEEPTGWPRTANRGALGTTREEYKLLDALRPGGRRALVYKRTGRCPTWYGAGVCTLEVEASAEPPPRRWLRRLRSAPAPPPPPPDADEDAWERRVRELTGPDK